MGNKFYKISKQQWKIIYQSCVSLSKTFKAERMGFDTKLLLPIKLYTDIHDLQHQFRLAFRDNNTKNGLIPGYIERQKSFYWWYTRMHTAYQQGCRTVSVKLYHGINNIDLLPNVVRGTFYGPLSTTININISNSFATKSGYILEISMPYNSSGFDVSWISDYVDEGEVLLLDKYLAIENIFNKNQVSPKKSLYKSGLFGTLNRISHHNIMDFSNTTDKWSSLSKKQKKNLIFLLSKYKTNICNQETISPKMIIDRQISINNFDESFNEYFVRIIKSCESLILEDLAKELEYIFLNNANPPWFVNILFLY